MNRLLIFFIVFTINSYSQTIISGKVTDNDNELLSGANVIVSNLKKTIIAYDITNINGEYNIKLNKKIDSLQIEVSFLGFSKQVKTIKNKTQNINFKLLESSEKLKEVFIKTEAIKQKGDTLSYNVSTFKNQKDRVIADVIKKMPGIDVLSDGKILYEGVPIQKYYIEGLDLLEGKYNLANNNLPASAVLKVQILENHQPIKILDSLVYSNKTSLNIKLKSNISLTGTAKIGAGFSPLLWDTNITPMLFGKKKQIITSYQTNNIGNDVANDIKYLTFEQILEQFEGYNDKNWLNINKISNPPFTSERWLNNNIHLISTNHLYRIKKDTDLKIDVSYINDYQQQNGKTETTYKTPNTNPINIIETTNNKLFFNLLRGKFVYNINSKDKYLKNTFSFNKKWNTNRSSMIGQNDNEQFLTNNNYSFGNRLKYTFSINKTLINFKSAIGYNKIPQNLEINFNEDKILNNNYKYNKFEQSINYSNFYTNNYAGFTKRLNKVTITTNLGFKTFNKQLNSNLLLFKENNQINLPINYMNNIIFNQYETYAKINFSYNLNNWKFTLKTPISYLNIHINDNVLPYKDQVDKYVFNPNLIIKKQLNQNWKIVLNTSKNNRFSDIDQLHYGYIFSDFRTINIFNNPILETNSITNRLSFIYKNPIKSLFYNFGYSYNLNNQNLIKGLLIQEDGSLNYGYIEKENNEKTHNITFAFSKYFSVLKTSISLNTNYSKLLTKQILNNNLTDYSSENTYVKGKINSNIYKWLNISFENEFSTSNSSNFDRINSEKYKLDLSFFPTNNQYISFNTDYYKTSFNNKIKDNYFINIKYKYQFKKSKIDLELKWNNILNTKYYISSYSNDYFLSTTTYNLRPSQFLLSAKFSLDKLFSK